MAGRAVAGDLTVRSVAGTQKNPLASGTTYIDAYSDGSSARTTVTAVSAQSIRFTVSEKTLSLHTEFPVAVGNDIFGRFTFDAAGGNVTLSASRSVGALGSNAGAGRNAKQLGVRMSRDGQTQLEFKMSFSGGVLTIEPQGSTAQAIFGQQRDEMLLNLMVGQAVVDAVTKLKATNISAVRMVH
jgi:hypothetical protein